MSGIVHQSRLARLLVLREQLDKEIAAERVIEKTRTRNRAVQAAATENRRRQERRDAVPAHVVRQWATRYGHAAPERGRVSDDLIDLYLDANPEALRRRK